MQLKPIGMITFDGDYLHVLQSSFFSQRYGERPEGLDVDYVEDLVAMLTKDITPSLGVDKRILN